MATVPDRRSLRDHGPYSAYCKVCWYSVYAAWIDDEPHNGACINGCERADQCPEAMSRAQAAAGLQKALAASGQSLQAPDTTPQDRK